MAQKPPARGSARPASKPAAKRSSAGAPKAGPKSALKYNSEPDARPAKSHRARPEPRPAPKRSATGEGRPAAKRPATGAARPTVNRSEAPEPRRVRETRPSARRTGAEEGMIISKRPGSGAAQPEAAETRHASRRPTAGEGRPGTRRVGTGTARPAAKRPEATEGRPAFRGSATDEGRPVAKRPASGVIRPATNRQESTETRPAARRSATGEGRPVTKRPAPGTARPAAKRPDAAEGKPAPKRTASRKPSARGGGEGERLHKLLAHAGIASRRACEELILEGRVQVNGETVYELGTKAHPYRDEITVDFVPIHKESPVYFLMNKPKGYVTTVKDDEGRPTVMALLHGVTERVYPVGRLDFQSEGLLLLTNDGELAHRLTGPDFHIPKVYLVKVHRMPPPELLKEFREGFRLDGRRLKPCGIEVLDKQGNPWLKVTLTEGKNQQIRRMFAAVGHPVHKLRRIQFGPLDDQSLKPGVWRPLTAHEIAALKSL